jgi:hypothetical protein
MKITVPDINREVLMLNKNLLASVHQKSISIWNLNKNKKKGDIMVDHVSAISKLSADRFITGSNYSSFNIFEIKSGILLKMFRNTNYNIISKIIQLDNEILAYISNNSVKCINITNGDILCCMSFPWEVNSIVAKSTNLIYIALSSYRVQVWDILQNRMIEMLNIEDSELLLYYKEN